jgi:GT2 family glycosyltransferase
MNTDVTIVIVTWNSLDDLPGCLAAIPRAAATVTYEITVVDNQSTDGTRAFVESSHSGVRLIVNPENRGFAAANNQALRLARSRYVLLLNPDTVLQEGAIDRLVQCLDGDASASAAGPAVLNRDGSPQRTGITYPSTWNILVEALFLDRLFPRSEIFGRHRRLYADPEVQRAVDYVQGSCLMVRSGTIARVGVLDEDYFMYFEETDWCYRMTMAGGKVLLCPAASVIHLGGEESSHYGERRLVDYHRSLMVFYRKHHSAADGLLLRMVLMVRSCIRIPLWLFIAAARPGRSKEAFSSVRGYVRTLGMLFLERLR